jgi:hypothetical protein
LHRAKRRARLSVAGQLQEKQPDARPKGSQVPAIAELFLTKQPFSRLYGGGSPSTREGRITQQEREIRMTRSLKTLGLAVLAITAMTAVMASAANAAAFTGAGGKNAVITVDQTVTNEFKVSTGIVKCTGLKIPATTVTNGTTTVTAHPEYSGCKAFGVNANVITTGCNYVFHLEAGGASKTDVVCSAGNVIKVTPIGLDCTVTVGSQTGLVGVTYKNGVNDVIQTINISAIHYIEEGVNCVSPGTHTNGTYTGTNTITGFEDVGGAEGAALAISVDL